jgi:hypothetical protein
VAKAHDTRVIRDIPVESIIAGNDNVNLRQEIYKRLAKIGKACRCIRCREIRAEILVEHRPPMLGEDFMGQVGGVERGPGARGRAATVVRGGVARAGGAPAGPEARG